MKPAIRLVSLLAGILLFSAWAAPILFRSRLLPFEFEPILNRMVMVLTLSAVYFIYVRGRERELLLFGCGGEHKGAWFLFGFGFGVLILVFMAAIEVRMGARSFALDFTQHDVWIRTGRVLLNALAVGVFEEWFFRGFLFSSLRSAIGLRSTLWWTSFFYAFTHYIKVGNLQGGAQASFVNSLKLMAGIWSKFETPGEIFLGSVGLIIFGYTLACVVLRTGSLYAGMGLHGGLVFALAMQRHFVRPLPHAFAWLFGDMRYYNGVLGWVVLWFSGYLFCRLVSKMPWPRRPLESVASS